MLVVDGHIRGFMKERKKAFSITERGFKIQTFRAGGKGGQHQNTCDSGVRIIHRESGAVSESRSERSQYQNKRLAFKKLVKTNKFKIWLNRKVFQLDVKEKEMKEKVNRWLGEENLKVEVIQNKKWVEAKNLK